MPRRTSRRTFLQQLSLGAASAVASPIVSSAFAQPADPVLDDLLRELTAQTPANVLRPGATDYDKIKYYNARFDCVTSTTYLRPTSAESVQKILEWASANRRTLAIRGAGHSFEAKSSHPRLVIDMSRMSDMRFDRATGILTAQAGVQLGKVYDAMSPAGYVLPAGTCPTVGLVGHTLGGGIGDFLPMFGYMAQSLLSVTLVTMSGSILYITDDAIEQRGGKPFDLAGLDAPTVMTALRGGGQGMLGVVTEMTFKAHDVRQSVLGTFKIECGGNLTLERTLQIIKAWQTWREQQSDAVKKVVSSKLNFDRTASRYGIEIMGIVCAPRNGEASMAAVRRSLDRLMKLPGKKTPLKTVSLSDVIKSFLDDEVTTGNPERKLLYGSSSVLPRALPDAAIEHFLRAIPPGVYMSMYTSGGAIKSGPPTALPHSEFLMEWVAWTKTAGTDLYDRVRRANLGTMERAGFPPFGFPNYCDPEAREYFSDRPKLEALRAKFDPAGVSTSSLLATAPPRDGSCPR